MDAWAEYVPHDTERCASIDLLELQDADAVGEPAELTGWPRTWEVTLAHELLHMHDILPDLDAAKARGRAQERRTDALSFALVT